MKKPLMLFLLILLSLVFVCCSANEGKTARLPLFSEPAEGALPEAVLEEFASDGKARQLVYDFDGQKYSEAKEKYVYSSFITLEEELPAAAEFENGCGLYVDVGGYGTFHEEYHVPVADEELIAVFRTYIENAAYYEDETDERDALWIGFKLVGGSGVETVYKLFRDGYVLRGGAQSKEPVSKEATAYFYAAHAAYGRHAQELMTYGAAKEDTNEYKLLVLEKEGERKTVSGERIAEFLKLVSDEEAYLGMFGAKCSVRINCGAGEHGRELLRFLVTEDGEDAEALDMSGAFVLYEDGTVGSRHVQTFTDWNKGALPRTVDQIFFESVQLSAERFPAEEASAFFESLRNN